MRKFEVLSHYANKRSLASYTFCGTKKFTPGVLSFPFYLLGSLIIVTLIEFFTR